MANGSDGSLSQDDIDALLSGVDDADTPTEEAPPTDDKPTSLSEEMPAMDGLGGLEGLMDLPSEKPKPVVKKGRSSVKSKAVDIDDSENMELLLDVKMNLSVELGRTSMQVEKVLNLGSGAIVELDKLNGELVDILVNNRLIARGEVVAVDENFGVKVVEIIDPDERFKIEL